ncbi:dihydropteroate synthase [Parasporobacterium paucivorans DSM 15970]|uniref:Dihydropteroate synthase n=2 Tax=Parasporobacterium TaxID=115543 RepID=A0A1M6FWD4_9FIRM|nr:dihydropteroate synthase [Parasporobacterium paucivorans]SHJ01930.1 dihydropteroate synthase [Parasporobacterium paucivorans DSM 15970]
MNIKDYKMMIGQKEICFGKQTYIMGILNVTPDSFSDGGDYTDTDKAVEHAKDMLHDGAVMIDVGGESTRPGYTLISEEEEIRRISPVIRRLREETDAIISVDTYKPKVAVAAIDSGAHIINDIWGLQSDPEMIRVAAKYQVPVIIMHNQDGTFYKDLMGEIKAFLVQSIDIALKGGLKNENIILDPGVGFGKTMEQNMEVMANLDQIRELGYPVLLGTSRKRMIGSILGLNEPKLRVNGTVATTVMGIMQGIDIVRVHDVRENAEAAKITDAIMRNLNG